MLPLGGILSQQENLQYRPFSWFDDEINSKMQNMPYVYVPLLWLKFNEKEGVLSEILCQKKSHFQSFLLSDYKAL